MHRTALKIFIFSLNCFVILGLSFMKPDLDYRQGQGDGIGIVPERIENIDNGYPSSSSQKDHFIPDPYYLKGVSLWNKNSGTRDNPESGGSDETIIDKRPFENKFFGSRGKRFGFMSFMPSSYNGWYMRYATQPRPRKRYHPNMFVSMRGKRLDDMDYRSQEDYIGLPDDVRPNKRYQGFTALRGRRSVKS